MISSPTPPEREGGPAAGRLSLVVFAAEFDKVHYALAMASAAAAVGRGATLFFTMGAVRGLLRPAADGAPGWAAMTAADGRPAAAVDSGYRTAGIGDFETLLAACRDLGVAFMVCEMGLKALGFDRGQLRDDVAIEPGGLATFLMQAPADGQVIFV